MARLGRPVHRAALPAVEWQIRRAVDARQRACAQPHRPLGRGPRGRPWSVPDRALDWRSGLGVGPRSALGRQAGTNGP